MMTVAAKAMAADQARAGSSGLLGLGGYPAVTGKGVGVAVIDSGIAASHAALVNKVVASVSFATGDPTTVDAFGHGTHIAGIIAGSPTAAGSVTSQYQGGVAPGAHLINVKVLGCAGFGIYQRRHRRHSVDRRQPRQVRHQGREPLARSPTGRGRA